MQFLGHIVGIDGKKPDVQKTNEHEEIFNWLKQQLITPSILQYSDYNISLILFMDAFYQGIGAVLAQIKNKKKYVIAYTSRTLSLAEKNYSTIELELYNGS
ncbi:11343_t:CDS:2 [Dentiscutata erythropus]|uniref:11343_t:CDS:1 n=1 Tax=Dentiscutata erythropus TaxID=1348616 RepID=A0A9N9DIE1_9GLOM|nr:11343_t:CDS:2 [Dentiscutata erythropus]